MLYRQYGWLCVSLLCRLYVVMPLFLWIAILLLYRNVGIGMLRYRWRAWALSEAWPWLRSPHFIMLTVKAKLYTISSDTHQLQFMNLSSTNQKQLPAYARMQDFCHHADTIWHPNSSYVTTKLCETLACGCNNNMIFQNKLFLRFLPSTYVAWQRRSLGDAAKFARWRHRWIHHFSCLKFRFWVTTMSNVTIILSSGAVV